MKISIVMAVLNSPEIVRRQLLWFESIGLKDDEELIIVDDGSEPPLDVETSLDNFAMLYTNDMRDWTQPAARNFGIEYAKGEYLICTDIDHIITRKLIDAVKTCKVDVLRFRREFAILNELGHMIQNKDVLRTYGLPDERIMERGFDLPPHGNSFAIKRKLYLETGGVSEKHVGSGKHPNREETPFKKILKQMEREGKITIEQGPDKPVLYMIPNGRFCGDKDYNPFGLFHSLERMTR